jgi:hypothetical protein
MCDTAGLDGALLKHELPIDSAVETEGQELQFSLIAEGVGLGLAKERPSTEIHSTQHLILQILHGLRATATHSRPMIA